MMRHQKVQQIVLQIERILPTQSFYVVFQGLVINTTMVLQSL
jgi:hypothetical protein